MAIDNTFGMTGAARGVQQHRHVFGVRFHSGVIATATCCDGVPDGPHVEVCERVVLQVLAAAVDVAEQQRSSALPQRFGGQPAAGQVGGQHGRIRIAKRELELLCRSPTVDQHRDCADVDRGGEGQDPVRTVAHRNGDPFTGLDAHVVLEHGGQSIDVGEELLEGQPLVTEDDKVRATVPAAGGEDVADRGCSVGEDAPGHAGHLLLGHGEDPIGSSQPAHGVVDELRSQSDDVILPRRCHASTPFECEGSRRDHSKTTPFLYSMVARVTR